MHSAGYPLERFRARHLEWELDGEAVQDGAQRGDAGAVQAVVHIRARHDDEDHVSVRKDP